LVIAYLGWGAFGPPANPFAPEAAETPFPLPVPLFAPDGQGRAVTFQHGRLLGLHVPPARAGFRPEDDFEKWDRRGMFHSAWAPPYSEQRFVDGCLLSDDDSLYVGALVGDPWALRSQSRPGAAPDGGWEGGSVQIRLATAGWPVKDEDATEKFFHLTFWHYAREERAFLHVGRGKRLELAAGPPLPSQDNSGSEFSGTFVPVGTRGYVMRCRVAWHLLRLEHGPRDRAFGLCWEVCWSDPAGEHFVGKLTEFFDPVRLREMTAVGGEPERLPGKQSYQRPDFWGKAIFPPAPDSRGQ
jgi:hypothetical protein